MRDVAEQEVSNRAPKGKRRLVKAGFLVVFTIAYLHHSISELANPTLRRYLTSFSESFNTPPHTTANGRHNANKPRIAIISSFVPSSQYKGDSNRVKDLDHLINKACYSYIWGYDFIFNMTYGFDYQKDVVEGGKYWLEYGTWSRVPHMRDRIEDYDWILYADTDYMFHDFTTPIESFFASWKLNNRTPSLLFPRDLGNPQHIFAFSAFALMVKNSDFGIRTLDNWQAFAHGLCENGNLSPEPRAYTWEDSDQPGIWYSIVKTHSEFFPQYHLEKRVCNNVTGLIDTTRAFGPELNQYSAKIGAKNGAFGSDLKNVPKDQPFLWSLPVPLNPQSEEDTARKLKGDIKDFGVQLKFGIDQKDTEEATKYAFAFHESRMHLWPSKAHETLDVCKRVHGCYAEYRQDNRLHIGCNGVEYEVAYPGDDPPSQATSRSSGSSQIDNAFVKQLTKQTDVALKGAAKIVSQSDVQGGSSATDAVYKPGPAEQYVLHHLNELGYDQNPASGCNLWRNSSFAYYQELQQYLQELQSYYTRVENFAPVTTDVRRAESKDICDSLELHPEGLSGIFPSGQLSKLGESFLEPALPPMRHPKWCLPPDLQANRNYRKYLIDISYLVHDFAHLCRSIVNTPASSPPPRTVLIDMGASLEFDFHKEETPVLDLLQLYAKFGIPFDHYYAYELKPHDPKDVFQKLPEEFVASYHWMNVGVETDPQSKLNPWKLLKENFSPDDFVVVKLDIDKTSIELELINQLLSDEDLVKLVDQFYFEHHVSLTEWFPYEESAKKSMELFHKMREKGIAAHYWV